MATPHLGARVERASLLALVSGPDVMWLAMFGILRSYEWHSSYLRPAQAFEAAWRKPRDAFANGAELAQRGAQSNAARAEFKYNSMVRRTRTGEQAQYLLRCMQERDVEQGR
jgi:hypothetical protein